MNHAKERPILMSTPMIKAILEGRKSQTRRVVKNWPTMGVEAREGPAVEFCPHGVPGTHLWVRETWCQVPGWDGVLYRADGSYDGFTDVIRWRPSTFMPRWASRITLEITGIRVQRVQEISFDDCIAEGIPRLPGADAEYRRLWDSLNGHRLGCSWESNPWVWVIEFKRVVQANERAYAI